ncbi:hypothetical protein J3459_007340 [Metarhizium acridum]|nr:hypothetical protein J3459_007340 [Metarhizium acridum]
MAGLLGNYDLTGPRALNVNNATRSTDPSEPVNPSQSSELQNHGFAASLGQFYLHLASTFASPNRLQCSDTPVGCFGPLEAVPFQHCERLASSFLGLIICIICFGARRLFAFSLSVGPDFHVE